MERIVSNIVELSKLYQEPCKIWLNRFKDGKIDAHDAFKKYGERYDWLYLNSPYDLIRWEIINDCFDWEKHSEYVPTYCPDLFNSEKYNWKDHSWAVAVYCPDKLNPDKFNWEKHIEWVIEYCPEKLKLINRKEI